VQQSVWVAASAKCPHKLNKLIKKDGSVLGLALEPMELTEQRGMPQKFLNVTDNTVHPTQNIVIKPLSSVRGFFSLAATNNNAGSHSCPQQ